MTRDGNGRMDYDSSLTEEPLASSTSPDSAEDDYAFREVLRRDSRKDPIVTALKAGLAVAPAALALIAGIGDLLRLTGTSATGSATIANLSLAGATAATFGIAAVSYRRVAGKRKRQVETRLKLADIPDPGVREVIGSATRGQAFLAAHLAEVQQSLKTGGAK